MREGVLGVPKSDFKINAKPDDPAVLIQLYRKDSEGKFVEQPQYVGHKMSTLRKIGSLEKAADRDEAVRHQMRNLVKGKQPLKDPEGGLTAAGRAHFKRTEGANLKPPVRGAADSPEKMRRKGSFLTRFFTNPSGPMVGDNGKPTRLALSAQAWGEPIPKNAQDAARLAAKGRSLLERYDQSKKG